LLAGRINVLYRQYLEKQLDPELMKNQKRSIDHR